MEKPFRTLTLRRQTSFFVSAIAFLSIYVFGIEVTSLHSVGLDTQLKSEFVRTVLYWATIYLFARYVLDIFSELTFFTWHRNWEGEASKWKKLASMNSQIISLMKTEACELTVGKLGGYNDPGRTANGDVTALCSRVQNILHNRNSSLEQNERMSEAIRVVEDSRLHILSKCREMYVTSLWRLFRTGIGIVPFVGHVVFDIFIPFIVFMIVLNVAQGEANWIKYENLEWFWIADPKSLTQS